MASENSLTSTHDVILMSSVLKRLPSATVVGF